MKDFHVVLESREHKGLCMALYGVICAVGLVCACLLAYSLFSNDPSERIIGLFMILPAAFFLMLGGAQLLQLAEKVHLVPQGIAVTLWGRTLARYPIEEIGMFFAVEWWEKGWVRVLGVSTRTPEEITRIREMQLKKGIFTRDELKFRKHVPDWQQTFRQEYLLKRARLAWATLWKQDILWLGLTPDNLAMLRHFYPEVSWEYLRRKEDRIGNVLDWKDKETTVFSRARNSTPQTEKIILACLGILIVPFFLLAMFAGGVPTLCIMLCEFGAILGILLCLGQGDSDMFYLSAAGIRIMRGKQEHATMFAADIRTIIKSEGNSALGEIRGLSIMVSTASPEELIKRAMAAVENTDSAVMTEIPGWEQRALFRFCTRLGRKGRAKNSDCQMLCWNLQREETLRRLYPDAEWIDLTPETIYS